MNLLFPHGRRIFPEYFIGHEHEDIFTAQIGIPTVAELLDLHIIVPGRNAGDTEIKISGAAAEIKDSVSHSVIF